MPEMIVKKIADEALEHAIAAAERAVGLESGAWRTMPLNIRKDWSPMMVPLITAHLDFQARVSNTLMLETQVGRVLAAAAAGTPTPVEDDKPTLNG